MGHEGKCRHFHGHNWAIVIWILGDDLDSLGRILDFGEVKSRVGAWLEDNWDHAFLANAQDAEALEALARIAGQRVYFFDGNPTAETMARHLYHEIVPQLLAGTGVRVAEVDVWETENCMAREL